MAKSNQRGHRYPTRRTAEAAVGKGGSARSLNGPLGLKDYVLLNVIFDAFCLVQLVIFSVMMDEMPGLVFFFVFIMLGFLLVSVFDFLACRATTDGVVAEATDTPGDTV